MKIKLIVLIVSLVSAGVVWGAKMLPFPGWEEVKHKSPNIIIGRCVKIIEDAGGSRETVTVDSAIQIVAVLKGGTNLGLARLCSTYWPRQGEDYLLFAIQMDGDYYAVESYRVVPLGKYFSTNLLTGKTLDEQIQILFQRRLDNLNRQMKEEQEEEKRLEEALKK